MNRKKICLPPHYLGFHYTNFGVVIAALPDRLNGNSEKKSELTVNETVMQKPNSIEVECNSIEMKPNSNEMKRNSIQVECNLNEMECNSIKMEWNYESVH